MSDSEDKREAADKAFQEQLARLPEQLQARGVPVQCEVCKAGAHFPLDRIIKPHLQQSPWTMQMGGAAIPCGVTLCNNCGHVRLHALGILDLLPPPAEGGQS